MIGFIEYYITFLVDKIENTATFRSGTDLFLVRGKCITLLIDLNGSMISGKKTT